MASVYLPRKGQFLPPPRSDIQRALNAFADTLLNKMASYPPAQPWKSRPPSKGPRAGGRRTGTLGRGWQRKVGTGFAEVFNEVSYAVYVEGPRPGKQRRRQTAEMRRRGWPAINKTGSKLWKESGLPGVTRAFVKRR